MKILQIVQTLDVRTGGVARAVLLLSEALQEMGHEVEIVSLDPAGSSWAGTTELPVHPVGTGAGGYSYAPDLLPWLKANGRAFDAVIVNGLWQYHGFAAWRAFAGSAVPYFVFPHGMLDPWFKRTYPLKHLKKWLYWPWGEYRVLRDARAVIFTAEEERVQARRSFWLYRARERISPLGVETPPEVSGEVLLAKCPELREKRCLLFLGRLHEKKGCDLLLEAFAQVTAHDMALIMVGPGEAEYEQMLRARAAALGIAGRVVFTGMLEGAMKEGAFAVAEAFVLPSHQENFGIAVVEALARGLPVLISKEVNIWHEVQSDGAGYVEADDLAGTVRLLERWLATTPEERAAMREKARACFAQRFEIHRAAESLLRILQEPGR